MSHFSGNIRYNTSSFNRNIEDQSPDKGRLNYFSLAFPFYLFSRNLVFSLNYQHLYEFSKDTARSWTYRIEDPNSGTTIADFTKMTSKKTQRGLLSTLSPALAIQILPSLYMGITANLWINSTINNYWENLNIVEGEGNILTPIGRKNFKTHAELFERYKFSGFDILDFNCFNVNLGLLWKASHWLTLGGVIKTPFEAEINRSFKQTSSEEYPGEHLLDYNYSTLLREKLTLRMPLSWGVGSSIHFSDDFLLALDLYRTHWEDYIMVYPSGKRISPINNKPENEADIQTTTQVRLGVEYLLDYPRRILPIRGGLFYDPEPAPGREDHFYGASLGFGYLFGDFVFDIAYQYRFGKKKNEEATSKVKQHYLYSSIIFYF
jgi:long-subunit fatty acid transport protein